MEERAPLLIELLESETPTHRRELIHEAQRRAWAAWAQKWLDGRRGIRPAGMRLVDLRLKAGWPNIPR